MDFPKNTKLGHLLLIVTAAAGVIISPKAVAEDTSENMQKLWEARITSPAEQNDISTAREINELINKIESLDFGSPKPEKEEEKPEQEKTEKPQPEKTEKEVEKADSKQEDNKESDRQKKQKEEASETEQSNKKRISEMVKKIASNPEQTENPLESAEILFRSGYTQQAAVFYEYALNNKELTASDKTWVLFQLGNCFENSDPSKAREFYNNLLIKYKDCQWTEIVQSKLETLRMKEENKLDELLSRSKELNPAENETNKLLSKVK